MVLKTIGSYAALVIGSLALGEVGARVYDWSPRSRDQASGDNLGLSRYYHYPAGFGDLVPNQDGHWIIWFHRPYHVQTNSVGLRHVEEPDDRAFRVLAVGDSQTFGPYLANDDTWPAWAENSLREHYHVSPKVQVFNAGIPGYTIADELAYLREKGIAFAPKLVLLAVFENDVLDLRREADGTLQRPQAGASSRIVTVLKVLGRNSAFVSLAEDVRKSLDFSAANIGVHQGEGPVAARPLLGTDTLRARYGALFRETVSLLKARNVTLAVIFIPFIDAVAGYEVSEMEPVIRRLAEETQTPYLDLTPAMRGAPYSAPVLYLAQRVGNEWKGNAHLSRAGNAVIGRAVADWLVSRGFVTP
jgi:lysophospholipase L1-like esterase